MKIVMRYLTAILSGSIGCVGISDSSAQTLTTTKQQTVVTTTQQNPAQGTSTTRETMTKTSQENATAGGGDHDPKPDGAPTSRNFGGLSFGVGIALSLNAQNQSRVTSTELVNGIVRVKETKDATAGILLESHYFFVPPRSLPALFGDVPKGDWGHGPFIAIEAASGSGSETITAIGLGWMFGLRQRSWNFDTTIKDWVPTYSTSSWNFGIGLRVDPRTQVLGDGIVANMPLPIGETSVRYKTIPQYGIMLVSSFSF